jgi:hypothetical protein
VCVRRWRRNSRRADNSGPLPFFPTTVPFREPASGCPWPAVKCCPRKKRTPTIPARAGGTGDDKNPSRQPPRYRREWKCGLRAPCLLNKRRGKIGCTACAHQSRLRPQHPAVRANSSGPLTVPAAVPTQPSTCGPEQPPRSHPSRPCPQRGPEMGTTDGKSGPPSPLASSGARRCGPSRALPRLNKTPSTIGCTVYAHPPRPRPQPPAA